MMQIAQSVTLGLYVEYFTKEDPSEEDTRNAYIYATGG